MRDALDSADPLDIDEPTQPYSRSEIERLRRTAGLSAGSSPVTAPPSNDEGRVRVVADSPSEPADEVEGWFELGGHLRKISLLCFMDVGSAGTPASMICSAKTNLVSGEIGAAALHKSKPEISESLAASAREELPSDPPSDDDIELIWVRKHRTLRLLAGVGLLVSLVVIGLRIGLPRGSDEPDAARTPADATLAVEPFEGEPSPADMNGPPPPATSDSSAEAPPGSVATTDSERSLPTRRDAPNGPACTRLRKQANRALDAGEWHELEALTTQRRCWQRASEHKLLRMQALFELERFRECVDLGRHDKAREVKKWTAICQTALD